MKITILGTTSAWGVNEIAGGNWPLQGELSNGNKVPFREYRTSMLMETNDGKRILVDCGPDFGHQRRRFGVGKIDAILLTHSHFDHVGGLDDCNAYRVAGGAPIPTYAHPETWRSIKEQRGFGYLVDVLKVLEQKEFRGFQPFTIGSVTITPFGVEHSLIAPGSSGFVFNEESDGTRKQVIYTGDLWAISNPGHAIFSAPADVLISNCDRWEGLAGPQVAGGHLSFQEVVRWLTNGVFSRPRPGQLVLVHFGDGGPKGIRSTYQDWREGVLRGLSEAGLTAVAKNPDAVVGYEGMVIDVC